MSNQPWDIVKDVVVVGSGAAGMAAALVAAKNGLDVLVLEKTEYFGGSTAVSGGAVWIPENPHMAEVGHSDSRDSVMRYLARTVGNRMRTDLMTAFLDNGPRMVEFMKANTEVKFAARAHSPDYVDEEGASSGGRTIDPLPFDGRRLGSWFARLRPPIPEFTVFGGMMVNRTDVDHLLAALSAPRSFIHSMTLLARYGLDRVFHPRGTRLLLGNALAARLLKSAVDAGITLCDRSSATEILCERGRVIGLVVTGPHGQKRIRARRGIVLATGGFPADPNSRARHIPHARDHLSMVPAGSTGDGIRLALAAGAVLHTNNANNAFWTPVSKLKKEDGSEIRFPHLVLDRQKPGLIAVNAAGRRFVNEATSYHSFVEAMHQSGEGGESAIPAFLICDRKFIRKYGLGMARPGPRSHRYLIKRGYLVEARNVSELAGKLGIPAAAFEDTVAKCNAYAKTGIDPEFGKGSTAYNRYLGDAKHHPNPCLGPIETAPFYAVRVYPGDIGTALGIKTNTHVQALDAEDRPISGLYVCGNDMNSVMAGAYPAAGITLGPALTFGYIAGLHLIDQLPAIEN